MKKTIIITGANSGLGYETTRQLAATGADYQLVMACRNQAKAEAAREQILAESPQADIVCLPLDTADLAAVRRFVTEFSALDTQVFGLVLNAGIAGTSVTNTADGFNNIFETNYLGHFLLTQLLLPKLAKQPRIIMVSSDRHDAIKHLTWPGAEAVAHAGLDPVVDQRSYIYSKLCMILFAYELKRQLTAQGKPAAVNAVNPGLMTETGLAKDKSRFTPEMLAKFADILSTAKDSAKMIVDLLTLPEFATGAARYYDRRSTNPIPSSALSHDEAVARGLWHYSMKAVGLVADA
jgi:NAD(P)-dependent dehydrogenase (short-subunit alcohol dehydrogenase family)